MVIGAVVLYHRAGRERLEATITALMSQANPPVQVVLVDNASADGVAERTARRFGLTALSREVNDGYGAGMLAGAAELTADVTHVLLLTHECVLDAGALTELAGAHQSGVGATGPRLASPDGRPWSDGGRDSRWVRRPAHEVWSTGFGSREVDWLDGAAILLRRDLVGLLPSAYGLYFEDVELGRRIRERSLRLTVVEAASATQDTQGVPGFWLARGWVLLERRSGRWARALVASFVLLLMSVRRVTGPTPRASRDIPRGVAAGWRAALDGPPPRIDRLHHRGEGHDADK